MKRRPARLILWHTQLQPQIRQESHELGALADDELGGQDDVGRVVAVYTG